MNADALDFIRTLSLDFQKDTPTQLWLYKQDKEYLIFINTELNKEILSGIFIENNKQDKKIYELMYINYLIGCK